MEGTMRHSKDQDVGGGLWTLGSVFGETAC